MRPNPRWDHPPNKNEISRRLALQTVHAAFAVQGRIPRAVACSDPESKACNGSSIWTGPVLSRAIPPVLSAGYSQSGAMEVGLRFKFGEGLKLKDVLSTNPDGTTNNCSARAAANGPSCCEGMPPFELQLGSAPPAPPAASCAGWVCIAMGPNVIFMPPCLFFMDNH
jgi:hypothetical protein